MHRISGPCSEREDDHHPQREQADTAISSRGVPERAAALVSPDAARDFADSWPVCLVMSSGMIEHKPESCAAPRLPVLMYHEISRRTETSSRLAVSPASFAKQLAYLNEAGFKTMTAGELPGALAAGVPLDRTIVLTFDDGYEDFHSQALPLLDRYGFVATVFVTSGWVQDNTKWPDAKRPGRMLSWAQVAEASAAGIEIGAHSCQHPQLDQLPAIRLQEELYASKAQLEDRLGASVPGLAYPFGYSSDRVRQVARTAGYSYGYAVANRTASQSADLLAIPRLTVHRPTTLDEFRLMIAGQTTLTMRKDRVLTRGYAAVRRTRAFLKDTANK